MSLFLPKRLKIKSTELKHEDGEGHGCKTFTLDFHPIRDLVVIKTVQNFHDLRIDVPRMQQRSVEIRRSKCKSYVVLRGAILEQ